MRILVRLIDSLNAPIISNFIAIGAALGGIEINCDGTSTLPVNKC